MCDLNLSGFVPAAVPESGRDGDVQVQLRSHLELEELLYSEKEKKKEEWVFLFFAENKDGKNSEQTSLLVFTLTVAD